VEAFGTWLELEIEKGRDPEDEKPISAGCRRKRPFPKQRRLGKARVANSPPHVV